MEKEIIVSLVEKVFRKVFGKEVPFRPDVHASEISGWDSLNHVTLVMELEKEFGLEFDLFEALELTGADAIIGFIDRKINGDGNP